MRSSTILLVTLAISVVLSGYSALLVTKDVDVGEGLSGAWMLIFAVLVAFWARADAAIHKVYRNLDFSFYFLVFWPVALPYYLLKTRGVEGIIYFIGFATLYFAPFLISLVMYSYWAAE